MNYAESFEQFSTRLGPTDLLLYAGAGIIVYVLFKEKLDPLKSAVLKLFNNVTNKTSSVVSTVVPSIVTAEPVVGDDLFFELVTSWKKTRDLAVQNQCSEAVKVADQMFPYLSPSGCGKDGVVL
jgi:LytS/YehU family sensor histidine kinase